MASPSDPRFPRRKIDDLAKTANRPIPAPRNQPPPVAEDGPTMLFDMEAIVQAGERLRSFTLQVERGVRQGQNFPIAEGTLVIGRGSAANIRLDHDSISRRHATLARRGNQVIIRDLGSQNGTFINRKRVVGDVELEVGDSLAIGQAILRLEEPNGPAEQTRASQLNLDSTDDEPWRPRRTPYLVAAGVGTLTVTLALAFVLIRDRNPTAQSQIQVSRSNARPEVRRKSAEAEETRTRPESTPDTPKGADADDADSAVKKDRTENPKFVGLEKNPPTRQSQRSRASDEAAVLAKYRVGDVAGAIDLAKQGSGELKAKLSRFEATLNAARERMGARDNPAAVKNFGLALRLDEGIAKGNGVYANQIRKQLAVLLALEGSQQMENENNKAARQAFASALKYDPGNEKAKAGMRKLTATPVVKAAHKSPPIEAKTAEKERPPAANTKRPPTRERAAAIDAAFGE